MSASHEWDEWHLTPQGWVRGSERMDFVGTKSVPPPPDRVLTRRYIEHMSSSFSKMDYYYETIWQKGDPTALLEQFGEHPMDFYAKYRAE